MCVNLRHVCGRIPSGAGLCRVTSFLPSFRPPPLQTLEEVCFKFALQHMTQVTLSDGFTELEGTLVKQFIQKAAQQGAFKT